MESPAAGSTLDGSVHRAFVRSNLRDLVPQTVDALAAGSRRVAIPAGATIHHAGEDQPHLELLVDGMVRVQVSAPDGRSLTIRYCRTGSLIGVATLYMPSYARPFAVQALVDSVLLQLVPANVRRIADRDPQVAGALLAETSERVLDFVSQISTSAFSSVRERVIRHVLDLASEQQHGSALVAAITQQQLAEAVGSAREVVVRILRDLRDEGAISTGRRRIVIHHPERLLPEWNRGS